MAVEAFRARVRGTHLEMDTPHPVRPQRGEQRLNQQPAQPFALRARKNIDVQMCRVLSE